MCGDDGALMKDFLCDLTMMRGDTRAENATVCTARRAMTEKRDWTNKTPPLYCSQKGGKLHMKLCSRDVIRRIRR